MIDNYPQIKTITIWAFSTENFNREDGEKEVIFHTLEEWLNKLAEDQKVMENKVKVRVVGQKLEWMPDGVKEAAETVMEATKKHGNRVFNVAVGYGGRAEILEAVKKLKRESRMGKKEFQEFLSIKQPVDLIIRTGGEKRLSGYLPWQSAYAELMFLDTYWPDFSPGELDKAMEEFYQRERRFGR